MKGKDLFREILGIQIIEVKDGYAKLSLKITKEHTNSLGAAHGGVILQLRGKRCRRNSGKHKLPETRV